jgi:hypothetical protein
MAMVLVVCGCEGEVDVGLEMLSWILVLVQMVSRRGGVWCCRLCCPYCIV